VRVIKAVLLVTLAANLVGWAGVLAKAPASQPMSIRERIDWDIQLIKRCTRGTNGRMVEHERVVALRHATEQSLQKPTVLASVYWPQTRKDGTVRICINWMEDKPSLKEVVVRNPETGKEQRVPVPAEIFDYIVAVTAKSNVSYAFTGSVSVDVTGDDPTQALEVFAPEQEVPATCYPSTIADDPSTRAKNEGSPATTRP
jgi:hypothetical protein